MTSGRQTINLSLQIATTNPGKLREFRQAAREIGVDVKPVPGLDAVRPCVEDGETFAANAQKKAVYYSALTPALVFADDSGLSVAALHGAPGVHSARYSGPGATDEANNRKLIAELAKAPPSERVRVADSTLDGFPASYICVIALARAGKIIEVVEGKVDGVVIDTPRGNGGFGYDPYFFYPPWRKTFAQVSAGRKFTVSHRGEAFRKLLSALSEGDTR